MFATQDRLSEFFIFSHVARVCATGGGSRGGGLFGPLGTTVPWCLSKRARRRPHPPCSIKSLETLLIYFVLFWCLVLAFWWGVVSGIVRLLGWFLFGMLALQDSTPCSLHICWSSFFFCLVLCLLAKMFSFFFLSLSGARETQTL